MNAFKEFLKKLFPDKASEIETLSLPEPEPVKKSEAEPVKSTNNAEITLLTEQIKVLAETVTTLQKNLEAEKSARETTVAKMQSEKVSKTLEEAIKAGKITPEQKETWEKRLSKDFDDASSLLNEMKANPAVSKDAQGKPGEGQNNTIVSTQKKSANPILSHILETGNIISN